MKNLILTLIITLPLTLWGQGPVGYMVNTGFSTSNLYKTTNSGSNWINMGVLPCNDGQIDFVDNTTGFYICDGSIYMTNDSGDNWTFQGGISPYGHISFINNSIGFLIFNKNIYKTVDSGVNWSIQGSTNFNPPNTVSQKISFVNEMVGYKIDNPGGFERTFDGGVTWESYWFDNVEQVWGDNNELSKWEICFINDSIGYISSNQKVYKTIDCGTSWTLQRDFSNSTYLIKGMSFVNDTTGYIDNSGYLQKTWNSGIWWTDMGNSYMSPYVWDIFFVKSNNFITTIEKKPQSKTIRKLKKVVDVLGREIKPQTNTPIIEIFDDGSVEKKLIIEK